MSGALGGAHSDYGVDDKFIKEVGNTIEPGSSAQFLLVRDWTKDRVMDRVAKYEAEVLETSLSKDDEAKLRAAFGEKDDSKSPALDSLIEPLTERELEVLRLVIAGLSNPEIAQELVIAVSTVKSHVNHIYGKLGVNNRVEAVARARALGLL